MKKLNMMAFFAVIAIAACSNANTTNENEEIKEEETPIEVTKNPKQLNGFNKAYFASGCFWCVEAVYEEVKGVEEAVSGYAGGTEKNPTYEMVGSGKTSHAESVMVYYDSSKVDFPTLVKVFFGSQDPTTLNRQGPDRGTQYRSIAFYQNDVEKKIIEDYIQKLEAEKVYGSPIVTEVTPYTTFYKAEDYHQNYEKNNQNNPYIQNVSIPRLNRFEEKFPELLK